MGNQEQAARHRILIVDDEESTRLLLARIASQDLVADVQLAGTCEQAIKLAENYAYDAILLDLLMPGIGGRAVLDEIRSAQPNAATPVIIVSIVTDRQTIESCLGAGANAYHPKPIRRKELVATIREQLEKRRATTLKS
jgi:DNA-binding response OmpR family regulator